MPQKYQYPLPLEVHIIEDYGTTFAEVRLGQTLVTRFGTQTRHVDFALEIATQTVAAALKPLIDQALIADGMYLTDGGEDD